MQEINRNTATAETFLDKLRHFFKKDIWRLGREDLSRIRWFLLKLLRVLLLTGRGFVRDLCMLRASALTFFTLLSIVPILAMAFGIAKGFGFEHRLQAQLLQEFSTQQEVLTKIFGFSKTLLENTKGGLIAGVGLVLLFWSVVKVLGSIENAFNVIWKVKSPRSLGRKFADYLSITLTSPVLMLMSGSITVFITAQVNRATENVAMLGMLSPVTDLLLNLLPYALIWIMFTLLYFIMPNTRVNLTGGLVAGLLAGSIFQIVQWAYIDFQVLIAKYNAIYGGFAALPLFLIWLHLSWLIVLMGAEFASAWQRVDTAGLQWENVQPSDHMRKLMVLAIMHLTVRIFARGRPAQTGAEIEQKLQLPRQLAGKLLDQLVKCGLLSRIQTDRQEVTAYQPAGDIGRYSVQYVVEAFENQGNKNLPALERDEFQRLSRVLTDMNAAVSSSPANRLLKDI